MEEGKKISALPPASAFSGSMELEVNHNGVSEKVTGDQIKVFVGGSSPVTSVFGRVGAVTAQVGDYDTSLVPEVGNLYFTNARTINSTLTGYAAAPGVISAADTVLSAIQKLSGNIANVVSSSYTVQGTLNRISISGTNPRVIDIDAAYVGQATITTVGTVTTGTWRGTTVQVGFGGTGTSTQFDPGSLVFAGVSGIYTQDSKLKYDNVHKILLLDGAVFSGFNSSLIVTPTIPNTYGISVLNATDASFVSEFSYASTVYPYSGVGKSHFLLQNTSTLVGSPSMIRFVNGNVSSANFGTLYTDGQSADFAIAVAETASIVTHSNFYIKGATGAVGIGKDLKTPTAFLHVSGGNANQSSFRLGNTATMPTGANRYGGDINYRTSTGRYYGYKANNTAEETFAFLSDLTSGSVQPNTTVLFSNNLGLPSSDDGNFNYLVDTKTLSVDNAIIYSKDVGQISLSLYPTEALALDIVTTKGAIRVNSTNTDISPIYIQSDYKGIEIDSIETSVKATSEKTSGVFIQTGEATNNISSSVVSIYRNTNLINISGTFDATGPMLDIHNNINNNTSSTGPLIRGRNSNNLVYTISKEGYIGIGNVSPVSAITIDGTTNQIIEMGSNPGGAGSRFTIRASGAGVGASNQAGGSLWLVGGSSRGTGQSVVDIYAAPPGTSGTGQNTAVFQARFRGDGKVGLNGVLNPGGYVTMQAPEGAFGFHLLHTEQTVANANPTGYGFRAVSQDASTNLVLYEVPGTGGSGINKMTWHKSGNTTAGDQATGNGLAKFHIKNGDFLITDVAINRFNVAASGRTFFTLKSAIKGSVPGLLWCTTTETATTGSSSVNIFSNNILGDTLEVVGDHLKSEYIFNLNEATKTKTFQVYFGSSLIFNPSAFSLINSAGVAKLEVILVRVGVDTYAFYCTLLVTDGSDVSKQISQFQSAGREGSFNLSTNNTLRVNVTCEAGSLDNGVIGNFSRGILNPNN